MSEYFPEQTSDDTDAGWNEEDEEFSREEELLEDVPPHHEE